jgi:hexokinase
VTPTPGLGIAVSIGGTNGYVSAFTISEDGIIKFSHRKAFSLPEKTKRDDLFLLIAQNIMKCMSGKPSSVSIGIDFAYPLKPVLFNGHLDGVLLSVTKDREIEGLVGKRVGEEFQKYLARKYRLNAVVIVANDTISLLAGGQKADIAGVAGTGVNFAYWEKRQAIAPLKLDQLQQYSLGEVGINIEAANFDKIPLTPLGKIVDAASNFPGRALSEKEAAGAYLYQIFNAGKKKLLGNKFPDLRSTDQLNSMITNAFVYSKTISNTEKQNAVQFSNRIFHRSAQIVAIQICGILLKLGKTRENITIIMEGGIFWKAHNYPSLVNLYINMILPEVIPSFARLFGSSRRGIAILAKSSTK